LALEFSNQNALLVLSSRNEASLNEVKTLCTQPENVAIVPLNLEDYTNFTPVVESAISKFGRIDLLINNGGISQRSLAKDTAIMVDKRIMDVNYMGTMALTKGLLPHFIANNSGQFVTITSITGKVATPARTSYSASKHALHGFFDSLRSEVFKHNINVMLVLPGYTQTNLSYNALVGDGAKQNSGDAALEKGIPTDVFAKKLLRAIKKGKNEVVIAGVREKLGVYLKRFFPTLLSKLVRKENN
ncbi:MAG: SDR family NAD(P)-dependent oxidoreductase, partial [Urechidicola sp.]|nr:SDR family NAD(P)-dependent oxidoreductase [Urechidicola sp.]